MDKALEEEKVCFCSRKAHYCYKCDFVHKSETLFTCEKVLFGFKDKSFFVYYYEDHKVMFVAGLKSTEIKIPLDESFHSYIDKLFDNLIFI